jgi:CheY-like chemotaxis protein
MPLVMGASTENLPTLETSLISRNGVHKHQSDNSSPAPPQVPSAKPVEVNQSESIDTSIVLSSGFRVLLVEDNEINMKLLVAYMRKLKLNHAAAINGLEALNTYKEANGCFDVIFMGKTSLQFHFLILDGLLMVHLYRHIYADMDGIESTRHIRRYERESSLEPVALIALTGAANPNTRQEAFSCGIDLYLTKPVPMKSLKLMLDNLKLNGREGLKK